MRKFQILLSVLLVINGIVEGQKVDFTLDLKLLKQQTANFLKEHDIPSIAIGVSKRGKTIWLDAYGMANKEKREQATPQHIFPIGSMAKSFAATGMMILVNAGKIELTDNINEIIGPISFKDIDGKEQEIKVWQVLSMTAGFNHGWMSYANENDIPYEGNSYSESYWNENVIVAFEPGTVYEYSNFSMGVAQLICEKISGKPYQLFLQEYLFEPLGMKNTYALFDPTQNNVKLYNTKSEPIEPDFATPAGGLGFWSSAEDLIKYGEFHLGVIENEEVISTDLLKVQHGFNSGIGDIFSLGWFKTKDAFISNGNVTGANAVIKLLPNEQMVIVSMINRTSWNSLADTWLGKIEESLTDNQNNFEAGYKDWKRIYGTDYVPNYNVLGEWEGYVKSPISGEIKMSISFAQDSTINVNMANESYEIRNPTLNLLNDITGSFDAPLKTTTNKIGSFDVHLHLYGDVIKGYIAYRGSTDSCSYRKPLYAYFRKIDH